VNTTPALGNRLFSLSGKFKTQPSGTKGAHIHVSRSQDGSEYNDVHYARSLSETSIIVNGVAPGHVATVRNKYLSDFCPLLF
jgi:hypothetical protein